MIINDIMVSSKGIEPITSGLGILRSIRLSYEDKNINCTERLYHTNSDKKKH